MSFRNIVVLTAAVALCGAVSLGATDAPAKPAPSKTEKSSKTTKETKHAKDSKGTTDGDKSSDEAGAGDSFSVIQIGNEVKVVKSSEVAGLREKSNEDFKKALQAFEDAKKAATKAKKKFADNKPVKPSFKTLFTALKSQADATAKRDKEAQRLEAQKKKAKEDASK